MILSLYSRVVVKVGDGEKHVFDRARLMYTEVAEIERVTGLSYGEWEQQIGRYSITAVGALLHVLRKRDGVASDFGSMQFNASDLDVVPLHDDGTEFTPAEVAADLAKRAQDANGGEPDPILAAVAAAVAPEKGNAPTSGHSTPGGSPNGSGSGPGSGSGSPTPTSSAARRTVTRS